MGLREKLNESPKAGIAVAVGLVLVATGFAAVYLRPAPGPDPKSAYFTDDDGQTYFKSSIFNFPPWDHDGKTAVGATVYSDGVNPPFVALETRYTPATMKLLEEKYQQEGDDVLHVMASAQVMIGGSEAKVPGPQNHWLPASRLQQPPLKKLPDGTEPGPVLP